MKPECEQAINTAADRKLSKAELDGIEERMTSSLKEIARKDPAGFHAMAPQDRLVEAAKLAKDKMMKDVVAAHEATIQAASKKAQLISAQDEVKPGLRGQVHDLKLKIDNIENQTKSLSAGFFRLVDSSTIDGGKFFGLFHDPQNTKDIAAALYGEQSSPEARGAADSIKGMLDAVVSRFQRSGLPLNEREDYRMPQPQEPARVAAAGKDAWVQDHLQWVDPGKYVNPDGTRMNTDQLTRMLGESYRSIATDGANKIADEAPTGGSPLVGGNKNAPRQLFYKDSSSWFDAMDKYGRTTNMYDLVASHVRGLSKDIAMADTFGRDAEGNVKQLLARGYENDLGATPSGDQSGLKGLASKVGRMWDATAHPDRPGNEFWANVGVQTRGLLASSQLGSLVGALPDLAGMKSAAEYNGLSSMRLFRNFFDTVLPDSEKEAFLHKLGIWQDGFQHGANRMAQDEFRSGWGTWLNETTHRLMGLNGFDRGIRAANGLVVMDTLGDFTRRMDLAQADGQTRLLADHGVTDDHWQTWQAAEPESWRGNEHLLTPDSIQKIPNEKLDSLVEQRVGQRSKIFQDVIDKRDAQLAKANPDDAPRLQEIRDAFQAKLGDVLDEERQNLKDEAMEKLMEVTQAQQQFGARGASMSTASDKVAMGLDSAADAGTVMGELKRFALQFKSVPIGIFRAHWDAAQNLPSATPDNVWGSKQAYLARYIGYSTLMGALSVELKSMINGQNPRNMNIATDEGKKFWGEALASGGGFGMYGDLFMNGETQQGGGVESLAGPGIGALWDIKKQVDAARQDVENGDTTHPYALSALRFVRKNATPFANMWYTKAAFNRLVYDQLQDQLAPGSSQKQQMRMQARGASYYWAPGTTTPQSAPDLGTAFQSQ